MGNLERLRDAGNELAAFLAVNATTSMTENPRFNLVIDNWVAACIASRLETEVAQ
jgi:hypothetical protein